MNGRMNEWMNKEKNEMLSDVVGGGLVRVMDVQSFFLLKKIGI